MTTTDTPEVTQEQEREAIASVPTGLFIAGEWRTTRATMSVVDPSTGQPLCEIADADPDEAAAALDAAADRGVSVWVLSRGRHRHRPGALALLQAEDVIVVEAGSARVPLHFTEDPGDAPQGIVDVLLHCPQEAA